MTSNVDVCRHTWIAGMMYVHAEDFESVARARRSYGETVECEHCDVTIGPDTPAAAVTALVETTMRQHWGEA